MKRRYLCLVAALIWGIPGCIITVKGIMAYLQQPRTDMWWLLLITCVVLTGFFFMFRRIVDRYKGRIAALPERNSVWQAFPLRGWILIIFMMGLGMALKFIPGVPAAFTASFYSGLGPMLIFSSIRFLL